MLLCREGTRYILSAKREADFEIIKPNQRKISTTKKWILYHKKVESLPQKSGFSTTKKWNIKTAPLQTLDY